MTSENLSQVLQARNSESSKLTVKTFVVDRREPGETVEDVPGESYVLIEGDRDALRFLAELILAQVDSDYGCNLEMHPSGAGSNHFTVGCSNLGLYLHRLPCDYSTTLGAETSAPISIRKIVSVNW